MRYVDVNSASPTPSYTSWATAARVVQVAVDAAAVGDEIVVTNGTYGTGGRAVAGTMTNRVALDKPLVLRSVNGPRFTVIQGYQVPGTTNGDGAIRCVYLTNGASLSGFTLTNGGTLGVRGYPDAWHNSSGGGGGAFGGTLNNCTLSDNSAGHAGGGAYGGTLNNCTLTGNFVGSDDFDGAGGGAAESTLNNCTLAGNQASYVGGGAADSTLNNCVAYFNTAAEGANYGSYNSATTLNYCCTTPFPLDGLGNVTDAPLFVSQAGGNLRLQSNSPCINAGNNSYFVGSTDLDGRPRIVGGTADIGAYEFQAPTSLISYAWLQQYGLPMDGSVDYTDSDADGLNNWQEWRCLTDPTNAFSTQRLLSPIATGTKVTVTWQSVVGVDYDLERSTNVAGPLPIFTPLATNLVGQPETTTYTDTNVIGAPRLFYRVGVGN